MAEESDDGESRSDQKRRECSASRTQRTYLSETHRRDGDYRHVKTVR